MSDHMPKKEVKYPLEFKTDVCKYAKKDSIRNASLVYNVPINTVGRWLALYKKAGQKGLLVTRHDTQKIKLDKKTAQKIKIYMLDNPGSKLSEVREYFGLDCSLSLISKKTSQKKYKTKNTPVTISLPAEIQEFEAALQKYNSGSYEKSFKLFQKIFRSSKKKNDTYLYSESAYYLGTLHNIFNDSKKALKYIHKSEECLKVRNDETGICLRLRAEYSAALLQNDYERAGEISVDYIGHALHTGDKRIIGNCLGKSFTHLYKTGKYEEYLAEITKAAEYNRNNGNYYELCDNLLNMMNVYVYAIPYELKSVKKVRDELNQLAVDLKLPSLIFESEYRMGIRHYRINELDKAEELLSGSLAGTKINCGRETYFSNILYLAGTYFRKGETKKAAVLGKQLYTRSKEAEYDLYQMHSTKLLAEIFMKTADTKQATGFIKKTIVLSERLKDHNISGRYHYIYGIYCKARGHLKTAERHYKRSIEHYEYIKQTGLSDVSNELFSVKMRLNNLYNDYNDSYELYSIIKKRNDYKSLLISFFFHSLLLDFE